MLEKIIAGIRLYSNIERLAEQGAEDWDVLADAVRAALEDRRDELSDLKSVELMLEIISDLKIFAEATKGTFDDELLRKIERALIDATD